MPPTIAVNIETIHPGIGKDRLAFHNSAHFELLCAGIGYRSSPETNPEIEVLWRDGPSHAEEFQALTNISNLLNDREFETLLTFNGTQFDVRHLQGRANLVADLTGDQELPGAMHRALETETHRDLRQDIILEDGNQMWLDKAVETYTDEQLLSLSWEEGELDSRRLPELGEEYLRYRAGLNNMAESRGTKLKDLLETYVISRTEPLFELRDALDDRH